MKNKLKLGKLISLILVTSCFPNFSTAKEDSISEFVAKMTLEEKVGQLFIVGFPQQQLEQKLKQHLRKNKLSSFLLFKRNIADLNQIRDLNKSLFTLTKEITGFPPILAVDQEGGFVNRLPIKPSLPHAVSIGLSKSPQLSLSLGEEVGRILSSVGFNMNLAPVLDLSNPSQRSFIGVRSYGAEPKLVGDIGSSYSLGLIKSKVVPTAKHFPGLGDSIDDPHNVTVKRTDSTKKLLENDLVPFKMFASVEGEKAIMLSHMIYPQLDESSQPASFSKNIIQRWLREELGFNGVVITDDLHMKASTDKNTVNQAVIKALRAGVDMVMLSWSFTEQDKAVKQVLEAYKSADLSIDELNAKVARILRMKQFVSQEIPSTPILNASTILSPEINNIESQLFLTKLSQIKESLLIDASSSVCFYSSQQQLVNGFRNEYRYPNRTFHMNSNLILSTLENSLKKNGCAINFLSIYNRSQAQMSISLSKQIRKNTVILNVGSTAFLRDPTEFLSKIHILSSREEIGKDLAKFLNELNTSPREVPSQLGLAQSRGVEPQSSRHPGLRKPTSSRPQ